MNKKRFGNIGEKIAHNYLKSNGYSILSTNYYTRSGEIDVIAKQKNYLIFIEVKTRSNYKYGAPSEAVNYIKKQHMKHSAAIFLSKNKFQTHIIRFDVIEVIIGEGKCKINHIKQVV